MPKSVTFMRIASAGMTALFIVWTYYQRNDIDPIIWMSVYSLAALFSLLFVFERLPAWLPMTLGIVCIVWAVYQFLQPEYGQPLITIEEWREGMGLTIVAAWMGVMLLYQRKRASS